MSYKVVFSGAKKVKNLQNPAYFFVTIKTEKRNKKKKCDL